VDVHAQSSISKKTEGTTTMPGFFPIYWDAKAGKMWLEIERWDKEFLYISSLPAGLSGAVPRFCWSSRITASGRQRQSR
jgi:hypothetical protein